MAVNAAGIREVASRSRAFSHVDLSNIRYSHNEEGIRERKNCSHYNTSRRPKLECRPKKLLFSFLSFLSRSHLVSLEKICISCNLLRRNSCRWNFKDRFLFSGGWFRDFLFFAALSSLWRTIDWPMTPFLASRSNRTLKHPFVSDYNIKNVILRYKSLLALFRLVTRKGSLAIIWISLIHFIYIFGQISYCYEQGLFQNRTLVFLRGFASSALNLGWMFQKLF